MWKTKSLFENRKRKDVRNFKCSKISNIIPFLFSAKMLVIRADIHKMLVRIATREGPDQTVSLDCKCLHWPLVLEILLIAL